MDRPDRSRLRPDGMSLIELVIVIVILGILATVLGLIITGPIRGFFETGRRVALVEDASTALAQMVRDIRAALPNSVRTTQSGGITALELLETLDGARYRDGPGGGVTSDADILTFNASSSGFNILGHFGNLTLPLTTTTDYLVIYNTGQTGANAYDIHAGPPNVITPSGTTISITAGTDEDHVSISPAFRFKYPSPYDRVYLVSGPVSWFCDPAAGTLRRESGYAISATEPVSASAGNLATNQVSACTFTYTPGTAERAGLVTLSLTLTSHDESVTLLREVQVVNAP
ncbi:protein containing Prepilin-type cleavage/methylation [mine drainage metagenome]|uniref:Protein containing Prepilin-type cleavage/methylation n=1 Tax=mine drainage metagenome TaxID=410659 RepID=T1AEV9_9ZZZZ